MRTVSVACRDHNHRRVACASGGFGVYGVFVFCVFVVGVCKMLFITTRTRVRVYAIQHRSSCMK
jgi:hypothetical protein